ncbi:MAG: hypothetical protein A2X18_07070 [Bacteroidetes bacterium GWF2_40_14]|nr:MAG: hypothetical protein A2X18_07070 [Bacteroidetes bacterium GWF2_40_14]
MKMEKLKKFWNDYKVWVIIGSLILLILISGFFYFYSDIALNFSKDNPNGEFFKVILSVLGGIGLIYGLWINSQRIKEQNRQNCISENSNSDQRFSDAIGYLGSDKTSIILGGIYALYQLAKEDCRYKSIVAGLFTKFLQEHSELLYTKIETSRKNNTNLLAIRNVPIIVKTILDLLINKDSIFIGEKLDFSSTYFKYITFKGDIKDCSFDSSLFYSCNFKCNLINCNFELTVIKDSRFGIGTTIMENCQFWGSEMDNVTFFENIMNEVSFDLANLENFYAHTVYLTQCNFHSANFINTANFYDINSFTDTVFSKESKNNLTFRDCKNQEEIIYL